MTGHAKAFSFFAAMDSSMPLADRLGAIDANPAAVRQRNAVDVSLHRTPPVTVSTFP